MQSTYLEFLHSKQSRAADTGLEIEADALNPMLFPFQRALTAWALRKGRAAIFSDCGTGKTLMQLEWARRVVAQGHRALIVAPLAVAEQTVAEGVKFGVAVVYSRHQADSPAPIIITNYEMVDHFDAAQFGAVILDESSILKNFEGKARTALIQKFRDTPYRLCCTATPAPNDIAELANHAEFLGIMTRAEMLANWFVHDDDGWRLKGHAAAAFYKWLASWAMMLKTPSDIGFSDDGYVLPPLNISSIIVDGDANAIAQAAGQLFMTTIKGVTGRAAARRATLEMRVEAAAKIINESPDQWIVWCGLNDEGRELGRAIPGAVVTEGKDSIETKLAAIHGFLSGATRVWVTKASIAGFGLNLQCCHNMMFLGVNDSYESFYQAVKREHRFGQQSPVNVQICVSDLELPVLENLLGKQKQDELMSRNLIEQCRLYEQEELGVMAMPKNDYRTAELANRHYRLMLGDCVERMKDVPDSSIDFSVFSPPFLSLYTYSDSDRDMGNSRTDAEFFEHFGFLISELLRTVKAGRIVAVHVAQVAALLSRDGYIGIKDFRGQVISAFSAGGFHYHGDITIDKNPQIQAIRIHAKGLAFQQLKKDASWMRPGLADYVLLFRKPGENATPIHPDITNEEWIVWAHPVWYGISETDTLNAAAGRENADDRHICPLQLGTIERAIRLWSNPGETVLSPFAGIGSEGYVAIKQGRRFVGIELKESYYATAMKNLDNAVALNNKATLWDLPQGVAI